MDKTLSAKQINILTKDGIKEPWNMPYQEAADKIGEILSRYDTQEAKGMYPVVRPGEPEKKPSNGNEDKYDWKERHCRAVALECAIKLGEHTEAELNIMKKRFFNWIWKGD